MKFWLDRWREDRIGWHEPAGNQGLQRHWEASDRLVLVPLCGKSPDLLWLHQAGNRVLGIEVSEIAARAFFTENELPFTVQEVDGMPQLATADGGITIVVGDYFAFRPQDDCGRIDACYDRAALIALPPELRERYAQHTSSLLTADAYHLLVTIEYDQALVAGPPFAVTAAEVRSYWPELRQLSARDEIDDAPPKFLAAGVEELTEIVWQKES